SYDRVGRWGGEEFILVMPDTNLTFAAAVAERVRLRIAEMQISMDNGEPFSIFISLGVACTSAQFPSLTKLIDAADQALYQAKQAGRNRVSIFEPLQ
ncbi:MAG: diguanylate cyclase, partial [Anaerolineales bacterium]|nr:diguanylate cyclase [Anaerolineales bacterium]